MQKKPVSLLQLREALEASWDEKTSYLGAQEAGNPALGQCYPTSKVVQFFFPDTEILKGTVDTGSTTETHFWNGIDVNGALYHIDLSWQQFPVGSTVQSFEILNRDDISDSEETVKRCALLLERVQKYMGM